MIDLLRFSLDGEVRLTGRHPNVSGRGPIFNDQIYSNDRGDILFGYNFCFGLDGTLLSRLVPSREYLSDIMYRVRSNTLLLSCGHFGVCPVVVSSCDRTVFRLFLSDDYIPIDLPRWKDVITYRGVVCADSLDLLKGYMEFLLKSHQGRPLRTLEDMFFSESYL